MMQASDGRNLYFGDLHSHCDVGYGHGSLQDAYANAQLQLDFVAVTPHAYWHDMPTEDKSLTDLVAYHRAGFQRTRDAWDQVREAAEAATRPGDFAAFLAFEWHSNAYGDHNVYFRDGLGDIFRSDSLEDLRQEVRNLQTRGGDAFLIPHHIGYRSGSRGINWEQYSAELSPVAEAMSMHGCAESAEAPYPYYHTMGSRDWKSTYQYGLSRGNIVGLIGSTDHHSAHPGSYGHGGLAVWADDLTRESIFEAIKTRRCYAITGDKIALAFAINGTSMGGIAPASDKRAIEVDVEAGSSIDYVEVLHNNEVIHRLNGFDSRPNTDTPTDIFKTHFEVGWGEVGENVDWVVDLSIVGGELVDVQPRFRGHSIVAPQAGDQPTYRFSRWERYEPGGVRFYSRTWGNVNSSTPGMQGVGLEIRGDNSTLVTAEMNGHIAEVPLAALLNGPHTGNLGGFLSPGFAFSRAVPTTEYTAKLSLDHEAKTGSRDWYYVRVRQHNGQWAWSSPIWVNP